MLDLTRTSARAVQDLKHYLEFAERGSAALGASIRSMGVDCYDSDFEMAVAEGLRKRSWDVRTQVGVSKFRVDLGVVHPDAPGRFLAGIECDGATYHSSPSARDRDRVRHIILEQLGWRLMRLWSTDWFLDPVACVDRLDAKLRGLLEEDRAILVSEPEFEVAARAEPERPAQLMTGTQKGPELDVDPARFYDADYGCTLTALVGSIIADETPITVRRLARLVARRHGFQRTGQEILRAVRRAAEPLGRILASDDGEEVLWMTGAEVARTLPFRGLSIEGEPRSWAETPYTEKLGFAREFLGRPDPARAMADALKLGRLTASSRAEFESLLSDVAQDAS
jgi:very-short-patch-repair endonuclease